METAPHVHLNCHHYRLNPKCRCFQFNQLIIDLSRPVPYELSSNTMSESHIHSATSDTAQCWWLWYKICKDCDWPSLHRNSRHAWSDIKHFLLCLWSIAIWPATIPVIYGICTIWRCSKHSITAYKQCEQKWVKVLRDSSIAPLPTGKLTSVEYLFASKWIYQHCQDSLPLYKEAKRI